MIRKVSVWILDRSTTAVTLGGLGMFVVFLIWVLPRQTQATEKARAGLDSPDSSFFYTAEELYHMAEDYGSKGRAEYIRARFTFDLQWPAVYMLFLSTSISWFFKRLNFDGGWQRSFNLVPVAGGLFDYLENLAAAAVMWLFPTRLDPVAWLASLFTPVKWVMIGGSFLLLAAGCGLFIWQRSVGGADR